MLCFLLRWRARGGLFVRGARGRKRGVIYRLLGELGRTAVGYVRGLYAAFQSLQVAVLLSLGKTTVVLLVDIGWVPRGECKLRIISDAVLLDTLGGLGWDCVCEGIHASIPGRGTRLPLTWSAGPDSINMSMAARSAPSPRLLRNVVVQDPDSDT